MDVSIALSGKGAVAAFTTTGVLDVAAAAAALSAFAAVAAHVVPASFDAVATIVVAADLPAAAVGNFFYCLSTGLAHVHALFIFRALFAMPPFDSGCR
jgi:hypothetical protein